ncbi:hypothetical protein PQX77_005295 [Marasmius sp. AFHP31]|nr:hypothetical protein PQX77_005295 [Marasmius sp. AFHP31]
MSNNNSKPTFNAVMLPPAALPKTQADGVNWVKAVFAQLNTPLPGKGSETALTMVTNNKNHVTIVLTPEFALNGHPFPEGKSLDFDAGVPLDRAVDNAVRAETQHQLSALSLTVKGQVIFAISSVVDTGRVNKDNKKVGCNRICVMSNKTPLEVQCVYKLRAADISGGLVPADGWDLKQWVISDGWSEFADRTISNKRLGTEGRLAECTYLLKELQVGGQPIAIAFGTCLDSMLESYPGTNIVVFCGGDTNEAKIQDSFRQLPSDASSAMISHDGYLINDTVQWTTMERPAGYRKWIGTDPKTRTREDIPSYAEVAVNTPEAKHRTLVVTQSQNIPERPKIPQLDLHAMVHNLSDPDHNTLVDICQKQLSAVNQTAEPLPASPMDILRLYNDAKNRIGTKSFTPIAAVEDILKQSVISYPQKPIPEGPSAWVPKWCTLL